MLSGILLDYFSSPKINVKNVKIFAEDGKLTVVMLDVECYVCHCAVRQNLIPEGRVLLPGLVS